ncbi:hypothetical protein [Streptomyces sp. NPDC057690]|uniref:hypothetical protein n=1 Tax=Streptomyces sp. NPDC057690 TaxID=3346214 RepID=UPI003696FDD4
MTKQPSSMSSSSGTGATPGGSTITHLCTGDEIVVDIFAGGEVRTLRRFDRAKP